MGRPLKKTLDFFMHEATARNDRKIKILRRRHGNDGYAAYFILLEMLCQEKTAQLDLSNSLVLEDAIDETGLRDEAHLYSILETCCDTGLFDAGMWRSERVVHSHGLYERYLDSLKSRKADAERKRQASRQQQLEARIAEIEKSEAGQRSRSTETDPESDLQITYTYTDQKTGVQAESGRKTPEKPKKKQAESSFQAIQQDAVDPFLMQGNASEVKNFLCPSPNEWNQDALKVWSRLWRDSGREPGDESLNLIAYIRKRWNPGHPDHDAFLDEVAIVRRRLEKRAPDAEVAAAQSLDAPVFSEGGLQW